MPDDITNWMRSWRQVLCPLDLVELRRNCHDTYNGGYQEKAEHDAFHHGMDTVFNVLDHLTPDEEKPDA